ncbi:MAG: DUF262 domain-containing HNH endonuclease family protein [Fimbriimonadales bacterium]|jgi:hypothetical protein|nr:DUF262 domain-containing HNH endonuclease family protein [Armatimonadota bacterium]MCX7686514.1 DUF262 domain-containing HNH endonuclease family protein [Fimbriimonadales bacterium]GBC91236.1 hypothetical protein HRbin14_01995 [bacterium HR14]CUU35556.1 Uncharacterized conserved protein, contains ParB-like and HNH nuclease domains [Armatimonadetes bacterium DC]
MKEIRASVKNIRALLSGAKFGIDYYQREYRWGRKQVAELIDDLADKFLSSHEPGNRREDVEQYDHYFLGSIIVSERDYRKYLIDGQQRITTLTLLLIYIYRQMEDTEEKQQLVELIYSQKYGRRSFNLDVEERTACMEALLKGETFDEEEQPESVVNMLQRYRDIEELFPAELRGETLPFFADWLIENVYLVEITTYSDADAYTIFETMNDRGLSLTPTEMLKGYLLANITDPARRNRASEIWCERVEALQKLGKEEEADAIKAWLRSQHAESIRERKRDAKPQDFDLIGTEFHRWVRDRAETLGLDSSDAFARFIEKDFGFYTRWYEFIRKAADNFTPGLEVIYYNARHGFTLQYPVLLAPLDKQDSDQVILRKLRVTATYLDILLARRLWNFRSIDYSTMQYAMFLLMRDIRRKELPALVDLLMTRLEQDRERFDTNESFALHGMNGPQIHLLLARMTDYVETQSGRPSRYTEYIQRGGKNAYQIEHIWANHPERHEDEFAHRSEFEAYRNRIGGLLLLPRSFNASYGDCDYATKREHYLKQNLLAASLHEKTYEHDPGFMRFIKQSGLPFRPHPQFKKADLDARQKLYIQLAEQIWSPDRLRREAGL